ncbi:PQQ-binding-like beta-propeller repeat protein [Nocardiopsis rhodophaea]
MTDTLPSLTAESDTEGSGRTVRVDYPPSSLSPVEPVLCIDGRRDGEDCTAAGTLRWSIPLEGDHYVGIGDRGDKLFNADSRITPQATHSAEVLSGVLYHAEDDMVRALDPETGEVAWSTDLRGDIPAETHAFFASDAGIVALLRSGDQHFRNVGELVLLDRNDGGVLNRTPLDADTVVVGASDDSYIAWHDALQDEPYRYTAYDLMSGDEKWSVEFDRRLEDETWAEFSQVLIDDVLYVRRGFKSPDSGAEEPQAYEVRRFDARTGDRLPGEGTDAPERWDAHEVSSRALDSTGERISYSGGDLRTYIWPPGPRSEADHAGIGTLSLSVYGEWSSTDAQLGVACAPDAVRLQDEPAAIRDALLCDNARLFAINQ